MKQKVVWMSWINWFVHTVLNVRHRDGLSRSFWTCWTLLNTMHLFGGLPLIQTGSKASHIAGDCFCTSWLQNYSMVTRLHVSGHRNFWRLQNVGVYRNAHVDQESSLLRLACLHHWVMWLTATLRTDVDDDTCARERKIGRRENATHVEYRSASSTAVWWRRVWNAPRVETNARVISEWAGAECDYCRGREDCSDALTWNTIISVRQIKSIFAAIAGFSLYNIYISQYSRQRSSLWYKKIHASPVTQVVILTS